jgi:hypothetical protein
MRRRRIGATVRWTSGPECSTPIAARNPVRRSLSEGEVEMRDRPKAAPACTRSGILRHHPSSSPSSSPANRSGSAMASMATIFLCRIVKSRTIIRRPRGATSTPTAPFTSTGRAARARPRIASGATASAPRTSCGPPPRDGHRVRTKDDIQVEDRQQALKVATSRGGQEGVDHRSLPVEVGVARLRDSLSALRLGSPALTFTLARSMHAAAGAAGELPRRGRRPPHDRRDLVEGDGKHVVQDERQPLGWLQHLRTTSSARPTESASSASCPGSTPSACPPTHSMRVAGCASPGASSDSSRLARAEHVEADPRHHPRQPAAQVLDAAGVGAAEAKPRLLHGVVRLTHGAEHAVGYRPKMGPMLLEPLRQPVALIHHCALSPARSSREITAMAKRLCCSRCLSRSSVTFPRRGSSR